MGVLFILLDFNSYMVRLRVQSSGQQVTGTHVFQFLHGAIKGQGLGHSGEAARSNFNSYMVRLRAS